MLLYHLWPKTYRCLPGYILSLYWFDRLILECSEIVFSFKGNNPAARLTTSDSDSFLQTKVFQPCFPFVCLILHLMEQISSCFNQQSCRHRLHHDWRLPAREACIYTLIAFSSYRTRNHSDLVLRSEACITYTQPWAWMHHSIVDTDQSSCCCSSDSVYTWCN